MSYEIHITIDSTGLSDEKLNRLKSFESPMWKYSSITGDPVLGPGSKSYLTAHTSSFPYAEQVMMSMWVNLLGDGYKLLRRKIEKIVLDERF